ncbi:hypothetical protein P153DRAFT_83414 [Dothidotthia symphoricarpi CBS 119687]|uniref:WSC domain-containing protein n=1 Tax=Dothidotthia symphoricarpi CBS 119687 TaxID=1392245 RepID=A0A6A6A2J5_9PLEO|nr:uncharacterized protein P153DRAFT_83414 [Dothidotthia symphoricarpi CBS 119687]KAF2126020.1 hypothetical protein P153DRAFT_83414 [Dothidotthia symphoricarpi CBS 119687]
MSLAMGRVFKSSYSGIFATLAILLSLSPVKVAASGAYCSSQNTATGDAFFWTFQSNGKCTDYCNGLGTYAFAVIQYTNCWCSNYIPSDQADLSGCQVDCPGFPDDKCGSKDDDLYIYLSLGAKASGTVGGSKSTSTTSTTTSTSTTSTSSSAATSSAPAPTSTRIATSAAAITPTPAPPREVSTSRRMSGPATVIQTVVGSVMTTTVAPSPTSTSAIPSARASTTLQTIPSSVDHDQDQTTVQVVTESGSIVTRTVVLTPSNASSSQTSTRSKSNTAAIVGGVVGGVAGIALVIGGILFFLWRRRRQQSEEQHSPASITRNTSTMSKAGLLGGKTEKGIQYPPKISTRFGSQNSRQDCESISPGSGRRYSQPLVFDSRLNPTQLMVFDNSSHGSIDDSHDYGRRLGVANPDPPNRDSIDRS